MLDPEATEPPAPRGRAPKGLTNRALGGMLWTFSGTGVQAVVQVLVTMALGRLLTPAEFGVMGAAVVVIALSQIVSQVGVGPAIVQRKDLDDSHIRTAFTISGGLGFVLGAALWLAAPALAAFYRIPEVEPVFRGMALLFPIDGLNTVGESLLSRQLRFRLFVALDVGCYIVGYACIGVFLAWQGYGVWALVAANLSQVTLRTIAMYLATRHSLRPGLDLRATKDLLSFGFGHSLAQVALVLSQQGDNMVVGRWLGSAALGIYGRAYSLMVMPATVFGKIVNRVLFPVMAHVQDERARLAGAYERALAIVALISLPVSAALWVVAPEFIPALLGPQWTAAVLPFRLFTCGLFFRMSSKITDVCAKAAGAVYSRALIQGVYAVLVVVGGVHRPALGNRRRRGGGLDRDGDQLAHDGGIGAQGDGSVVDPVRQRPGSRTRARRAGRWRRRADGAGHAERAPRRARGAGGGGPHDGGDRRRRLAAPARAPAGTARDVGVHHGRGPRAAGPTALPATGIARGPRRAGPCEFGVSG